MSTFGQQQHDAGGVEERRDNIFSFRGGPRPAAPTLRPTTTSFEGITRRDFNYRKCVGDTPDSSLSGVANVHFVYDVETTAELSEEGERSMIRALEMAMIDSIFQNKCRRRLSHTQRSLEFHSISSGNRDTRQGACAVTSTDAIACYRYDGSVRVGYTGVGDDANEMQAGHSALQIISMDMMEDKYLNATNAVFLTDTSETPMANVSDDGELLMDSLQVTRISYVGTSFYDIPGAGRVITGVRSQNWTAEGGTLSKLGRAFLPIIAIVFAGIVRALYMAYRSHRRKERRMAELAVLRTKEDDLYFRRKGNKDCRLDPSDDDVHDLATRATNQGDDACNSTNCASSSKRPPLPLHEIQIKPMTEGRSERIEVLDPSDESVISGITNPISLFHGWPFFSRKVGKPMIRVEEESDEKSTVSDILGVFEDEPRTVASVKVNNARSVNDAHRFNDAGSDNGYDEQLQISPGSTMEYAEGKRKDIVNHAGIIREEIEL